MQILAWLFRWRGTVSRTAYLWTGVILFALKYNLDRLLSHSIRDQKWYPPDYLFPLGDVNRISDITREDGIFVLMMLAVAAPFIWIGVGMTIRRLRSIGLPLWLASVFFLPFANLVFFALLSILPEKTAAAHARDSAGGPARRPGFLERTLPRDEFGSGAFALLFTLPAGLLCLWLSVKVFQEYGWVTFIALPFVQGLVAVLLYGHSAPRTRGSCYKVAAFAVSFLGLATVLVALEGIICLIMASPLMVGIGLLGAELGYEIQAFRHDRRVPPSAYLGMFGLLPLLMGAEAISPRKTPLYEIVTSVEIDAPPQRVWDELIAFSEMRDKPPLLFRMGVAYPIRAEIEGTGVGAVRYCVFSTGAFVEPIEVWDEPRLLRFSVTDQPPIMREWSPYHELSTAHLEYLRSRRGQFLLVPLADGGTRLEWTTWYEHDIWPAAYWRLWSDWIIHEIHKRVLNHIKLNAEKAR